MEASRNEIEITNTNSENSSSSIGMEDANDGERIDDPILATSFARIEIPGILGRKETRTTEGIERNIDGGVVIEEGTTDADENASAGETNVVIVNTMMTNGEW